MRAALAYFVVVWSLAVVTIAAAAFGVDSAIRFSAFFSGIVGVVIGYYFGRHGVDKALQTAEQTGKAANAEQDVRAKADLRLDEAMGKLRALESEYTVLSKEYTDLLRVINHDPGLKRKLKGFIDE